MANEDGMNHYLHPEHRLAHVYIERDFMCDGCEVEGHGVRFRCHACNFDLHEHCARCSSTISVPMHSDHLLTLHVLSQDNPRRCDVCRKTAIGMCYRCVPCGVDIHPLCTLVQPNASNSRSDDDRDDDRGDDHGDDRKDDRDDDRGDDDNDDRGNDGDDDRGNDADDDRGDDRNDDHGDDHDNDNDNDDDGLGWMSLGIKLAANLVGLDMDD